MNIEEFFSKLNLTNPWKRVEPDPNILQGYNEIYENEQYRRQGRTTQDTGEIVGFGRPQYAKTWYSPDEVYSSLDNEYYRNIPSGYGAIINSRQVAPERTANAYNYALQYPGTAYTPEILNMLRQKLDEDTLLKAIAVSQAETGMGKNMLPGKSKNMWNLFVGGDSGYEPEDWNTMISDVNRNFGPEGRYRNISIDSAGQYTGGDSTSDWMRIVGGALKQMGY